MEQHPNNNKKQVNKVFVGGLRDISGEEFETYFKQFGDIIDIVIIHNKETKLSRGFGFVTFANEESTEQVLRKQFHELENKSIEVKRALPKQEKKNTAIPTSNPNPNPNPNFAIPHISNNYNSYNVSCNHYVTRQPWSNYNYNNYNYINVGDGYVSTYGCNHYYYGGLNYSGNGWNNYNPKPVEVVLPDRNPKPVRITKPNGELGVFKRVDNISSESQVAKPNGEVNVDQHQ